MSSLLGAFILSFTVLTVVAIGILAAYAAVIGILHSFAPHSTPHGGHKPVLVASRARAAHAGGD